MARFASKGTVNVASFASDAARLPIPNLDAPVKADGEDDAEFAARCDQYTVDQRRAVDVVTIVRGAVALLIEQGACGQPGDDVTVEIVGDDGSLSIKLKVA